MCSPYLTGLLGILLCLVTYNYWSVTTENSGLVREMQEKQQQLHKRTKHIENMEEEMREIRTQLKSYKARVRDEKQLKNEVEIKLADLRKERDDLKKRLKVLKSEGEKKEREHIKALNSLEYDLEGVMFELISLKKNLTSCQAELSSELSEKDARTPDEADHLGRGGSLGPGQLNHKNLENISVIQKGNKGIKD